jgi:hypothetical protein
MTVKLNKAHREDADALRALFRKWMNKPSLSSVQAHEDWDAEFAESVIVVMTLQELEMK